MAESSHRDLILGSPSMPLGPGNSCRDDGPVAKLNDIARELRGQDIYFSNPPRRFEDISTLSGKDPHRMRRCGLGRASSCPSGWGSHCSRRPSSGAWMKSAPLGPTSRTSFGKDAKVCVHQRAYEPPLDRRQRRRITAY